MQSTENLTKKQLAVLEAAKKHIKDTYKEGVTSMVTILATKSGMQYTGANVKYKKIWKCICSERVAIAKAMEANDSEFDTITTIKYFPETDSFEVINMCGECRQIAICHKPLTVIADDEGKLKALSIEDLLPFPYS